MEKSQSIISKYLEFYVTNGFKLITGTIRKKKSSNAISLPRKKIWRIIKYWEKNRLQSFYKLLLLTNYVQYVLIKFNYFQDSLLVAIIYTTQSV